MRRRDNNLYIAEAKRRFHDNAIFVDVAQTLTDFQEEMGMETFKELEEEIGGKKSQLNKFLNADW